MPTDPGRIEATLNKAQSLLEGLRSTWRRRLALTLETLAQRCTAIDQQRGGATTHGPLIVTDLLTMLAEDCAMTLTRPGSWEGANMARVLAGHGYELAAP